MTRLRLSVLLFLAAAAAGCSSSRNEDAGGTMREHERSFDPSQYRTRRSGDGAEEGGNASQAAWDSDRPAGGNAGENAAAAGGMGAGGDPVLIQRSERVMGYRVQVQSTTDADEATRKRDDMRELFPDMPADLVFHAPYYKVRLGNFEERAGADSCRALLQARGFPEAWVVRDMVTRTRREEIRRVE